MAVHLYGLVVRRQRDDAQAGPRNGPQPFVHETVWLHNDPLPDFSPGDVVATLAAATSPIRVDDVRAVLAVWPNVMRSEPDFERQTDPLVVASDTDQRLGGYLIVQPGVPMMDGVPFVPSGFGTFVMLFEGLPERWDDDVRGTVAEFAEQFVGGWNADEGLASADVDEPGPDAWPLLRRATENRFEEIRESSIDKTGLGPSVHDWALSRMMTDLRDLWADDEAAMWLRSSVSYLGGARPIDVLDLQGVGPVHSAVDQMLAGSFA